MKNLFFALPMAALAACGNDDSTAPSKDAILTTDFESLVGWVPDPSTITKEKAHSGLYSLKVDQNHEFSLSYSVILGQLSSTRIRGIKMDAWAYMPNKEATAKLGFILKEAAGGKDILGDGIELGSQVKEYGKWVKISKEVNFPASAGYSSQIVMFLWRAGSTGPAYVDDIQLTALR
ncbi:hypothetical protein [Hymenobacter sp.]|uniref:hypothetical protein n=1 Tax=Hymenobacter sp. TaxID=1898978 RepID=UPI00286C8590|nr:hypothetical protein [Hymenobacter sp.]